MGWAVTDHVSPKDPSHPQDIRNMKLVFSIAAQAETWGALGRVFLIRLYDMNVKT